MYIYIYIYIYIYLSSVTYTFFCNFVLVFLENDPPCSNIFNSFCYRYRYLIFDLRRMCTTLLVTKQRPLFKRHIQLFLLQISLSHLRPATHVYHTIGYKQRPLFKRCSRLLITISY